MFKRPAARRGVEGSVLFIGEVAWGAPGGSHRDLESLAAVTRCTGICTRVSADHRECFSLERKCSHLMAVTSVLYA